MQEDTSQSVQKAVEAVEKFGDSKAMTEQPKLDVWAESARFAERDACKNASGSQGRTVRTFLNLK